jgi:hypothetical protein
MDVSAWARMNALRRELTSACAANETRVSWASVCDSLRVCWCCASQEDIIIWSGSIEVWLSMLWLLPAVYTPQLCLQCLPSLMAAMMEPSLIPRIGNARALRVSRDGWTLLRACARSPLRHPASRHGFVAGDAAYHLDADYRPHLDRRGP